jgi:putative ABC transport system permease protein
MWRTILAGLKARTARLVLSSIAIALGVAFVTGTLVLGDAMNASFRDEFAKGARNVDASITLSNWTPDNKYITQKTLDEVRAVAGVAGADAKTTESVPLIGGNGKAKRAMAVPLATNEKLREFDLSEGRYPQSADEIALDARTATSSKLAIGQQVSLLGSDNQKHAFTIVGTYQQGTSQSSLFGEHMVLMPEAIKSLVPDSGYDEIVAMAAPGVSQQQLIDNIGKAIGTTDYRLITGEQMTREELAQIAARAGGFTDFLLAFAVIALVVAAMVIYNTFTILVAQRTRELALLRCVGAGRGQVFRSVLAEALFMGVAASVLGLFGGLGVSALLQWIVNSFGGGSTEIRTPLTATTVLVAFAVGVLVTVLSAVLPARRATRVAPVAALRSQPDSSEEVSRTGKLRILFAVLVAVAGAGTIGLGMQLNQEAAMLVTGAGTMVVLAAVLILGPVLVGPVNRVLGALPRALFGVPAKLASANAGRNPKRTAATTAALMIGVTIVSMVTVVATSAKESANAEIDNQFPADYTVKSSVYDRTLPKDLATQLAGVPEVAKIAPRAELRADLGNLEGAYVTGVSGDVLSDLIRPKVVEGELDTLGDGEVALQSGTAGSRAAKVGETVTIATEEGGKQSLKVVALYEAADQLGTVLVTLGTAEKLDPKLAGYDSIMVKLKPGVSAADGRAAVEKVTDPSPLAAIDSAAETKAQLSKQLDQLLALVWALIGLAVVIALFGIANTLALSVLERTRETALLRALGLTRNQLRTMLVMGAAIGLVLGIGFGWVFITAMSTEDFALSLTIPFGQIGTMLVAAVIAAIVAAALPARRAGRTSVVAGMAEA